MSPEDALQVARDAQRAPQWLPQWPASDDPRIGLAVRVMAGDYGRDPISGTLTAVSDRHLTVSRDVAGVGTVRVHVPKVGFEVVRADG